jgi:2-iminobutanoate/2-iminopropanoate deaminase
MPQGFESNKVWRARGRGFQMGVVHPDGVTVSLTGQVAWSREEQIVGRGDVAVQTRQCFENIRHMLAEVGGDMSHIVAMTTYFTDRSQLPVIQQVRREFLDATNGPVSTSVMVAGLGHPDFLVEITPVAVIPPERFKAP